MSPDCKNIFGHKAYGLLKSHLHRLIGAQTEQECNEVVSLAYELLKSQTYRDDEAEQNLEEFVLNKNF